MKCSLHKKESNARAGEKQVGVSTFLATGAAKDGTLGLEIRMASHNSQLVGESATDREPSSGHPALGLCFGLSSEELLIAWHERTRACVALEGSENKEVILAEDAMGDSHGLRDIL